MRFGGIRRVFFITLLAVALSLGLASEAYAWGNVGDQTTVRDFTYKIIGYRQLEVVYYSGRAASVSIPQKLCLDPLGKQLPYSDPLSTYTVTSIAPLSFFDMLPNESTTQIRIPASVTKIDPRAFLNCTVLTSIAVDSGNSRYASVGGVLYDKAKTKLIVCPSALSSVVIPSSVRSIGDHAFKDCRNFTRVEIPNGATTIGAEAFGACFKLQEIVIPQSVTSIGPGAFGSCSALTKVTIPDKVRVIEANTFMNCTSLTSVTIPAGVTSVGDAAFENCYSLTSMAIPTSVTRVGWAAFLGSNNLKTISFQSATTAIYDEDRTLPQSAVIAGWPDSTAKRYAEKYGRQFVSVDLFVNPLTRMTLSQPYANYYVGQGWKGYHPGVDIAYWACEGDPIVATADGTVIAAYRNGDGANVVVVEHDTPLTGKVHSQYVHMNVIGVRRGDKVYRGQTVIGEVGNTGISSGAHLHFEIKRPYAGGSLLGFGYAPSHPDNYGYFNPITFIANY